jgi:hypothetical protein
MVAHQAVRPYRDTVFITPFGHKPDIIPIIIIAEKSILPAIATLGYMMGIMLCNYSCDTGHDCLLFLSMLFVNQYLV